MQVCCVVVGVRKLADKYTFVSNSGGMDGSQRAAGTRDQQQAGVSARRGPRYRKTQRAESFGYNTYRGFYNTCLRGPNSFFSVGTAVFANSRIRTFVLQKITWYGKRVEHRYARDAGVSEGEDRQRVGFDVDLTANTSKTSQDEEIKCIATHDDEQLLLAAELRVCSPAAEINKRTFLHTPTFSTLTAAEAHTAMTTGWPS